eukprot:1637648-Rhodomonas_salina.1
MAYLAHPAKHPVSMSVLTQHVLVLRVPIARTRATCRTCASSPPPPRPSASPRPSTAGYTCPTPALHSSC